MNGFAMVANDVPQLFVDDVMVAAKSGLVRTLHPGRKLEQPVLVPDRPWEGKRVYIYGTVHYDEDSELFRMWYLTRIGRDNEHRSPEMQERQGDLILYATSVDGVHWDKPNLGRYPFDGSTANNIIVFDKHRPHGDCRSGGAQPRGTLPDDGVGVAAGETRLLGSPLRQRHRMAGVPGQPRAQRGRRDPGNGHRGPPTRER